VFYEWQMMFSSSIQNCKLVFLIFAPSFCLVNCDNEFFDWVDEKGNIISYDIQRQYDDYLKSNLNSTEDPYSSWMHETFICFNTPISDCLLQTKSYDNYTVEDEQKGGKQHFSEEEEEEEEPQWKTNNGKPQENGKPHKNNKNEEQSKDEKLENVGKEDRKIRHLFTDSYALRNFKEFNNLITKDLKLLLLLVYEKLDLRNLIKLFQNARNLETLLYFTNTTGPIIDIPEDSNLEEFEVVSSLDYLYLCGTFNPSTASLIQILKPKFLSTKYLESEYDLSIFQYLPPGTFTEIELGRYIKYSPDVFNFLYLQNIEKLGMAKSYLKEIPQELTHLGRTLKYLSLASNDLSSINHDTKFPKVDALLELDLRFCQLKSLNSDFFDQLPSLKSVSLSGNSLLQFNHQNNLNFLRSDFVYLDLKLNPYSHIISLKYSSSELRGFSNPEGFFLDLSYTYFKRCKSDSKYFEQSVTHLSIINSVSCFKKLNFTNLINLEAVDASYNIASIRSPSIVGEEIDHFFKRISNVRVLLFRENHLKRGLLSKPHLFETDFKSLEVLHLGGNDLDAIPYHLFQIPSLKSLNLSSNSIKRWNHPLLGNNQDLDLKVDLSSNKITWITKAMEQDFYRFKEINLKDNVLQCNAQLQRLVCATQSGSTNETLKILNMEETTCFHMVLNQLVTLEQLRKKENCQRSSAAFLLSEKPKETSSYNYFNTQLLWILGTIFVCLILYAAWNWNSLYRDNDNRLYSVSKNLQLAAYLPRFTKKKESFFFNYRYDVFVSYAGIDRDWVIDRLVPNLETDSGIRICLHERDFQIGMGIMENIVECIDQSQCLLLVISKSFVKSNWCLFEMNLGQYFTIESNKPNVILVLLEEIPRKVRPKVLSYLMQTRTYIEWPKYAELDQETDFFHRLTKALNSIRV
ncbi:hypothetical protein LSTR_LSTR014005, partial [Laodelphax striatellus]